MILRSIRSGLLLCLAVLSIPVLGEPEFQEGLPVIALEELPAEARETLRIIRQGGPFSFYRDGVVFKNYERVLPIQPRGYYREYTVKTPGAGNRGARRIVCGLQPECYYSADHYQTFKRIRGLP